MRKYAPVWARLAKNEKVTLTCPARGVKSISAALYNEKYRHQKAKEDTDLPGFGRIKIEQEALPEKAGWVRLIISIPFNGENL